MPEGIQYKHVEVRVILPEGATNVKFQTSVPLVGDETSLHKTFMDTLGRTALKLTAVNVVDEAREAELIVCVFIPYHAGLSFTGNSPVGYADRIDCRSLTTIPTLQASGSLLLSLRAYLQCL